MGAQICIRYQLSALKNIINEIEVSKKSKKAFIYFNNDIDVSAVKNAIEIKALTER